MNEISKAASLMSALGASKGGRARAQSLSADGRSAIARRAAQTRWGKVNVQSVKAVYGEKWVNGSSECDDPRCPCHQFHKQRIDKYPILECILGKPLLMVIPPEGVHLSCPVHGKHFLAGSRMTL